MTTELEAQAGLAVLRAVIRYQQLVEAVTPLDQLLDGHQLEPIGHQLGDALAQVGMALQQLADTFAPVVDPSTAGAADRPKE